MSLQPGSNLNVSIDTHSQKIKMSSGANLNMSIQERSKISRPPVSHFKMLDLFCGEGLAAWGYWLSGRFSEIVGIDNNPKMARNYSFDFIEGDALKLDYDFLSQFDFIHASPPCQAYSKRTPRAYRANHPKLVAATHLMLYASGKPYVIENVEGAGKELRPNIVLNGQSIGLSLDRRRYFHASTLTGSIRKIMRSRAAPHLHSSMGRDAIIQAMGLQAINPNALKRMTVDGMLQGIPPAMTKYISTRLFNHKVGIA